MKISVISFSKKANNTSQDVKHFAIQYIIGSKNREDGLVSCDGLAQFDNCILLELGSFTFLLLTRVQRSWV